MLSNIQKSSKAILFLNRVFGPKRIINCFLGLSFLLLQGCLLVGANQTDIYVKKLAKTFSYSEGLDVSTMKVSVDKEKIESLSRFKGKILIISKKMDTSLAFVERVNKRLIQLDPKFEPIVALSYKSFEHNEALFNDPKIFNILVDRNGIVRGSNIRSIKEDNQCEYYLDYYYYYSNETNSLSQSFSEYKYAMIDFYKWDYPTPTTNNRFGKWLQKLIDKKIYVIKENDRE